MGGVLAAAIAGFGLASTALAGAPPGGLPGMEPPPIQPMPTPSAAAALVNDATVTRGDVDEMMAMLSERAGRFPEADEVGSLREQIRDQLVTETLLRQRMARQGPKIPEEAVALLRGQMERQLAAQIYRMQMEKLIEAETTEEKLRAYFEAHPNYFDGSEVRVRHILVPCSQEAPPEEVARAKAQIEAIHKEATAPGADFAALARKNTTGPSARLGGDLGTYPRRGGQLPESLAQAAFALKLEEISAPVRSSFGFHVLQVTERQAGKTPSFPLVREQVRQCMVQDLFSEMIADERTRAKRIEVLPLPAPAPAAIPLPSGLPPELLGILGGDGHGKAPVPPPSPPPAKDGDAKKPPPPPPAPPAKDGKK